MHATEVFEPASGLYLPAAPISHWAYMHTTVGRPLPETIADCAAEEPKRETVEAGAA